MRNRSEGPRRAAVAATNLGGGSQIVILEECEDDRAGAPPERRLGLFAIEADDQAGLVEQIERLAGLASGTTSEGIDRLARKWWASSRTNAGRARGIAVIADGVESLERLLKVALKCINGDHSRSAEPSR